MTEAKESRTRRPWLRLLVLAAVIVAGMVLVRDLGLARYMSLENVEALERIVQDLGWIGPLVYILFWIAACLFILPGLPISLLGAAIFGVWWGLLWVTVGANLGAQAAFLAARYGARSLVEDWAAKNPNFRKIDEGVARHGWRMVMITRLVPLVPFNFQNYAYGMTRIRFSTYALVSLVCMIPGSAAYVFAAGSLVSGKGDIKKTLLYLSGAAVLFVVASLIPGWLRKKYAFKE
ncbi:MAG: TVP38/TMEM64 family protein [Proteobacteria bacterium]|nr:TVP38/TMEM64 family protein [Pseudomonadota bacterium]